MYLRTLSNEELVRYARASENELTTSDLERELIVRLEEASQEDERLAILDGQELETADDLTAFFQKIERAQTLVADL
ncbi:hypothetical protein [Propionivibrio dicarboxylicus]|uniref:Uncharacterized protein n=1 Tax=Propionivibrio dicarboxylicus TaxID=83767 RepID=A0A1G8C8I2_9RHOO|nr:hypothetical protein [Propionivibrio dicarboxylicus]SDH41786.1 hypothetical protein SAMN05660652_01705 [Propionivibrio dicarboxylicus]